MCNQHTKRSLKVGVAIVAGLLVVGTVLLRFRPANLQSAGESEGSAERAQVGTADTTRGAVASGVAPAVVAKVAVTLVAGRGDDAQLRIKAGAVLATVNGVAIELKDLMPLPADKQTTEQILSAERYAFLLDRAVDRELTLQEARAQGLDLTESQRTQLAKLCARSERPAANRFDDLQHNPANAEFEARDATALLLQASLAEKAGVPSRDVTAAQVEQYYQQHPTEFGVLSGDAAARQAAWEQIEQAIRVKLARHAQARHDEGFERFCVQLRSSAQIVKTEPHL